MQRVGESFFTKRIHVWGAGFIEHQAPYKTKHFYHAVRGKLSKNLLQNKRNMVLGDPGLLANLLLKPNRKVTKKYTVGFIEHYKDKNNSILSQIIEKNPNMTRIDIYSPPLIFLERISECEIILSSAMHGLIAADAIGIPNAWLKLSDRLRGGDFKFQDYYGIFGINAKPETLNIHSTMTMIEDIAKQYSRPNINGIKNQLYASFPSEF
jgi:polysaccharide pyruvyl transferase WcaK-like protein